MIALGVYSNDNKRKANTIPSTFTPPTYTMPLNDEDVGHGSRFSLWRHYQGVIPTGYSVLITDEEATAAPGTVSPTAGDIAAADSGSGEGGKAWFRGGIPYVVTDAEVTILTNAGYTQFTGA